MLEFHRETKVLGCPSHSHICGNLHRDSPVLESMKYFPCLGFLSVGLISIGCRFGHHLGSSLTVSHDKDGYTIESGSGPIVKGSGKIVTKEYSLGDFSRLDINSPAEVVVSEGQPSVKLTIDDNLVSAFDVEVRGGQLVLMSDKSMSMKEMPKLVITTKDLSECAVGSATKIDIRGGTAKKFTVDANGAAVVTLIGTFDDLNFELNGASRATVTGATNKLTVDNSGASSIDLSGLTAKDGDIEANGASKVTANVTNQLKASASGASTIWYTVEPKSLVQDVSGASKVIKK